MPWLDAITWARRAPALASATPRSRYVKKSRRPLTSTGWLRRAWATFWLDVVWGLVARDLTARGFVAVTDDIVSSIWLRTILTAPTGRFNRHLRRSIRRPAGRPQTAPG